VRASAERASTFVATARVPDDVRLKAERASAAIASTGFQVAQGLSEAFSEARDAAAKEAASVNEEWRSVLGTAKAAPRGDGADLGLLLDCCAQPFAHGHALAPEIDRLQRAVDGSDDDALLRRAHQRLRELDLELPAPLLELSPPLLPPDIGSSAAAATAQEVCARESHHDATRDADERATRERLAVQRDGFLASLKAST
jgi:hypothetical protein